MPCTINFKNTKILKSNFMKDNVSYSFYALIYSYIIQSSTYFMKKKISLLFLSKDNEK